jgi:hypothetical protein
MTTPTSPKATSKAAAVVGWCALGILVLLAIGLLGYGAATGGKTAPASSNTPTTSNWCAQHADDQIDFNRTSDSTKFDRYVEECR